MLVDRIVKNGKGFFDPDMAAVVAMGTPDVIS